MPTLQDTDYGRSPDNEDEPVKEFLAELPSNGVGALGMVAFAYWLIVTGKLVPGKQVDRQLADKDSQIATLTEANQIGSEQVEKLTAIGEMQVQIMQSIHRLAASKERK